MEHTRNKTVFSTIIFILFFTSCIAQSSSNKKEGITCCVDAQLKVMGRLDAVPTLLKGSKNYITNGYSISIDNSSLWLKNNSTEVNLGKIDSVKTWIESIELESLKVYNLASKSKKYFLFSSKVIGATGLAVNFYQWLIIDANSHTPITTSLLSLSDEAKMFFIKENVLNIKVFEYGDDFYFKERDWDNPPIKVITYKVQNNILKKKSQINTVCKCQ